jgi:hypothetical protein
MPLYCCEACGWASTGLRVDAVAAHQAQCPECAGLLRMTFNMVGPEPPPATVLDRPYALFRGPAHTSRRRLRAFERSAEDYPSTR